MKVIVLHASCALPGGLASEANEVKFKEMTVNDGVGNAGVGQNLRSALYQKRRAFFKWRVALRRELALRRLAPVERRELLAAREKHAGLYRGLTHPLVSVTIPTYNRSAILVGRTIPSVLSQTYANLEIVIVGDACTDDTYDRIARLNEPRIRFYNLAQRGSYPTNRRDCWMVAGCVPLNRALEEAKGEWIAHLDDDDVFEPDHIEQLLSFASSGDFEFVYSQMLRQVSPGEWISIGSDKFETGVVPHSTVFFRNYLRLFRYDIEAWRYDLAGDDYVSRRMARVGVRFGFLDRVTTRAPLRPGTTRAHYAGEDWNTLVPED